MPQIKLMLLCLVGLVEFGVARKFTFVFEHTSEVAEDLLQNLDRLPEFLDTHVNVYERNGGERRRVYVHPTQCFINTNIVREKVRQLQEDGSNTIELGKCLQIDKRQTLYLGEPSSLSRV